MLCSSAARAVGTLEGVRAGLPADTVVEVEPGLYGASADVLLRRLRGLPEDLPSVMLVGHNPAIENLALGLAGGGDGLALERMAAKYPTGALATLTFEGAWAGLDWDGAALDGFVVPRELE